VLAGARQILARDRPILICEIHSESEREEVARATAGWRWRALDNTRKYPHHMLIRPND
jgi:hypothetical protein